MCSRATPSYEARRRGRSALGGDTKAIADGGDLVEDRGRHDERVGRRYLVEVVGDVVRRRWAAGIRQPALGQPDEDASEAAGVGRVVLMGEVAGATGEEHDDRHHELWLDRP